MNLKFWKKREREEYNPDPDRDLIVPQDEMVVLGDDPVLDMGDKDLELMLNVTSKCKSTDMRWVPSSNVWAFTCIDQEDQSHTFHGKSQTECLLRAKEVFV